MAPLKVGKAGGASGAEAAGTRGRLTAPGPPAIRNRAVSQNIPPLTGGFRGRSPGAKGEWCVGYLLFRPDDILITSGDATEAPRGERIPMNASLPSSGEAATKARTAEPLYGATTDRRVTVRDIAAAKARGEKCPRLTADDALTARVFDAAGIPVLLVGDSAAMVVYGHDSTIPVTVDDLIPLTAAVARGSRRAMVVADLPFGSYQVSVETAMQTAVRFLKETGAHAVKLEGGHRVLRCVEELVAAGIPVMAHLGLTPQSVNVFGGYRVQGRGEDGEHLLHDANVLQAAGAFSVVLEYVPASLAAPVTEALTIPTIGIRAGPSCDAQVLVWQDMAGLSPRTAKFVKKYADLTAVLSEAATAFADDVTSGAFPDEEHSYR